MIFSFNNDIDDDIIIIDHRWYRCFISQYQVGSKLNGTMIMNNDIHIFTENKNLKLGESRFK